MAVVFNWIVESVRAQSKDNRENIIRSVDWRVNAKDIASATNYGTVNFPINDAASFVKYQNLTEAQILSWVKSALGKEEVARIEENLANEIDTIQNGAIREVSLPWHVAKA